mmetsp:Transcript_649/g.1363  ORF Transcript_649/g.1363 Transcript_649/m.1363 type:complete len:373 (-) Transcript_649:134-1252(-)
MAKARIVAPACRRSRSLQGDSNAAPPPRRPMAGRAGRADRQRQRADARAQQRRQRPDRPGLSGAAGALRGHPQPPRDRLRGGAHGRQARGRDARAGLHGDRGRRQDRVGRDLRERRRPHRYGSYRTRRAAHGRKDRPALCEPRQGHVQRPRELRRPQLRPRCAHGLLGGHGAHHGRAEGPLARPADVHRPAGGRDPAGRPRDGHGRPVHPFRQARSGPGHPHHGRGRARTRAVPGGPGDVGGRHLRDHLQGARRPRFGAPQHHRPHRDRGTLRHRGADGDQPREGPARVRRRHRRRLPGRHGGQHHPGPGRAARHAALLRAGGAGAAARRRAPHRRRGGQPVGRTGAGGQHHRGRGLGHQRRGCDPAGRCGA